MKLFIEQDDGYREPEIHIKCGLIDADLQRIIDEIQTLMFSLPVSKEGAVSKLSLEEIFYFESVDERTYVYSQTEVYACDYKLYEVEEKIGKCGFARISKSVIVNIRKIQMIKPQLNGRFEAVLDNGEHLIVNRHYVSALKEKFVRR
ncbi:MAG: LytTR family transcriptional regulator [Lachnospiraceae bacterium]|nr:LytTR family transcriptional regulator [Lachnospiraceae bacterium]MDE7272542.1 LytTR family transcriptional regulator [Lachnospiraceae bacterium]